MSEEIKTELNEDDVNETVCLNFYRKAQPTLFKSPTYATPFVGWNLTNFKEDDFKVTSEFDDTRQEDDTDGLEDLERVSVRPVPDCPPLLGQETVHSLKMRKSLR